MVKQISLIGCGSIGTEILTALKRGDVPNAVVIAVFDTRREVVTRVLTKLKAHDVKLFTEFEDFVKSSFFTSTDIVVEAASKSAVIDYGEKILRLSKKLVILSSGAFEDTFLLSKFIQVAEKYNSNIVVPSGAIAGLDAIRSVKGTLDHLSITTTKNPSGLKGAPYFDRAEITLEDITTRTVLFEGSATDAISKFPANVNVAVTLALAGLGLEKTFVRVVADPNITVNQHEIHALGSFGEFTLTTRNRPMLTNPKTSFLAALSAIEAIRGLCSDSFRIGS